VNGLCDFFADAHREYCGYDPPFTPGPFRRVRKGGREGGRVGGREGGREGENEG
jgi:hypothetical protein